MGDGGSMRLQSIRMNKIHFLIFIFFVFQQICSKLNNCGQNTMQSFTLPTLINYFRSRGFYVRVEHIFVNKLGFIFWGALSKNG